jgi:AcrR family transcriptional regulator
VSPRRDDLLDAAITVLGEGGVRGVTHKAVDIAAGLPAGSTSNYFRTKDALLTAVVERFAARERANWENIAAATVPTTPTELARALAAFAHDATGPHRTLTLARYAILVESAIRPALREQLAATGGRVRLWFTNWLRLIGSTDPDRHTGIVMNSWTGLVLHQLAYPNPAFDPTGELTALVTALVPTEQTSPTKEPAERASLTKESALTKESSA